MEIRERDTEVNNAQERPYKVFTFSGIEKLEELEEELDQQALEALVPEQVPEELAGLAGLAPLLMPLGARLLQLATLQPQQMLEQLSPVLEQLAQLAPLAPQIEPMLATLEPQMATLMAPMLEQLVPMLVPMLAPMLAQQAPQMEAPPGAMLTQLGPMLAHLAPMLAQLVPQMEAQLGPMLTQLGPQMGAQLGPVLSKVQVLARDSFYQTWAAKYLQCRLPSQHRVDISLVLQDRVALLCLDGRVLILDTSRMEAVRNLLGMQPITHAHHVPIYEYNDPGLD